MHRKISSVLLMFASFAVSGFQQPGVFLKGPYLQWPGLDTITVMWESSTNAPGTLRYSAKGETPKVQNVAPETFVGVSRYSKTNVTQTGRTNVTRVSTTNIVYHYETTLTGLTPGMAYAYVAEVGGARTIPKKFSTLKSSSDKVTFIAYGDDRTNPNIHAAVAARFKRHSPDFILHTGDLTAAGRRYDLWGKEFFAPLKDVIDEIPFVPAPGNHEEDLSNYLHYVHLPGNERWYSFDAGPVHILALDFHFENDSHAQFEFAKKDLLSAKAPWKIVTLHHPVFNVGGHGTGWGHAHYLPLFHEAKVDLVVVGHSHIYERFRPIAGIGSNSWPITHITTGGGGAPLTTSFEHPALVARAITNHYVVFEATASKLSGHVFTTNGTTIDTFELSKVGSRLPEKYLAAVYPEEMMQVSFRASTNLTGRLTAMPTPGTLAQAMFAVYPFAREPVELEIELAPDSLPYYQMIDGPLHLRSPVPGETNKVAWAKVVPTGNKGITTRGRNRELVPELIFKANVKAGKATTVAYGQPSRISATATEAAKRAVAADTEPE